MCWVSYTWRGWLQMFRLILSWIIILLAGVSYLQAAAQAPASPAPSSPHRTLLNRYCVTCHNEKLRTAELLLDKADVENVGHDAPVWEKVVSKLQARQMPPSGMASSGSSYSSV